MKKIILVDGNNLLFRSYYATSYSGNVMKNSKGLPTNALYGFVGMINKIIEEEKPEYMAVAFDIGKNFRAERFAFYKDGRKETPEELKVQMPYARKLLDAMGIKYFEMAPYEADDIIGTFCKLVEEDDNFNGTIVSSDKDLLQLMSKQIDMKLLKQKGFIRYNPQSFYEEFGIEPINVIDLKALAGDASDNIPGVRGIGDKTALKLLNTYKTIEELYNNIDSISGKVREKLETDKEMAFVSKEIATIYKDVPISINSLEELKYNKSNSNNLKSLYEELEFYSFLKKMDNVSDNKEIDYIKVSNINDLVLDKIISLYIEIDNLNYHKGNIISMAISDKDHNYLIDKEIIRDVILSLKDKDVITYDEKKNIVILNKLGLEIDAKYDLMLATYLLNYNIKDDISYLMNEEGVSVSYYEESVLKSKDSLEIIEKNSVLKSRYIFDNYKRYLDELEKEKMLDLFLDIEMPLVKVLADMEITGVIVNKDILDKMKEELRVQIDLITQKIYDLAGVEFNISSPKQLGDVLFDRLGLPYGVKGKTGYKTDVKVMHKLKGKHPIIDYILEYRNKTKIYSTYIEGLESFIYEDGKVHTIFKQTLTRTGRLSSVEPNIQNIPIKDEEGRKIRKAFLPSNDCFLSADYSQIELRILAHISNCKELIEAFNNDMDIHTKVAADIYGVEEKAVSKKMRSTAKAVIFGIVYGISGFGLGENLEISPKEAKEFIDKYYELYPGVKKYMDDIVKSAYKEGSVRTLFNRKRVISELESNNYMIRQSGERIALNTPIQGTSADIIKKAMIEIYNEFKKQNIKSKLVIQVHDELIIDLVEGEKDIVTKIVTEKMTNVIKLSVPLKVSSDYGNDWYEVK